MKNEEDEKVEGGDVDVAPCSPALPRLQRCIDESTPPPSSHHECVSTPPHGAKRLCLFMHTQQLVIRIHSVNTAANVEVSSHNGCPSVVIM